MTCPSVQVSARTKDHNKTPGAAWKCKHKRRKPSVGTRREKKTKKKRGRELPTSRRAVSILLFQSDAVQAVQFWYGRRFVRAMALLTGAACTNTHAHVHTRTSRGLQVEAGPQLWRSSLADRRCGRRHKSSPDKHRALNKRRVAPLVLSPSYLTCHVTPAATPRPV